MKGWITIFLCWGIIAGCDDGGGDQAPEPDAEARPDMTRQIRDSEPVDVALQDAAVDAASADADLNDADPGADRGACAACNDGLDNDRDGRVDFPDDPDCTDAEDDDEASPVMAPRR
ncbi:MAG: hypothetical protein R3F60_19555 [bacterium]